MSYRILVRRLWLEEGRYVTASALKERCNPLGLSYEDALSYLFRNKYVVRILRGFFYIPTVEERRLKTLGPNPYEAITKAMEYKKIKNWYFGLETAIKWNNITHEHFTVDYVVSDTLFRAKPIIILGRKIKFVKLKKSLFDFGIKREKKLPYSDLEKTILDLVHIRKYAGRSDKAISDELTEWAETASKTKLRGYAKHYSLSVRRIMEKLV
ncbi:MAG: hypothetical protein V1776_01765 [Candidatus Diapherotrites archaeon]